jgi:WD40 repeat protein
MSRDALIVGINAYQYLPSLQAPARDAEAIAQRLHTSGEFRVHRLPEIIQSGKSQVGQKTPVTLQELEAALINLFKPKGNNPPHTALFYYSGHGIQRDAGIREGYLAVSDANPDKGFCGLSLFWLRRLLQESPVRQRIVILDCCHSGELLNFLEADPGAQAGTDRLFMAASKEYETAYESLESPYSVFTQALITGLDPSRTESGIITNHSLTDWVNHSLKGEIQQPLFESSGSEIILTRGNGQPSPTKTVKSTDICPYRGLEFFDESHAEFFFGREELSAQLIDQLKNQRFAAVSGASGSGKSSLLRAGVISHLQQEKTSSGADAWKIKLLTPGEHPLKSLAAAFIDPELSELERAEQLRRAEAFLQDGGIGLAQLIRASLAMEGGTTGLTPRDRPQLLLVIDQFEEIFTLAHGAHIEEERQRFFDCLMGALQTVGDYLSIAVVVRADFLSKCSLYDGLAQKMEQHRVTVPPLKYEQIKATIVRPAQKVGLVCEPNLVYTMLLDIIGAPGELPLLQYTLMELWQHRRANTEGGVARLTLDAYRELGGVRGTLQKQATEIFMNLSLEEQTVAKRIFLALTQLGEGTEDTRRRVIKSELVSPIFPVELVEQVLEKLVAAKLVITNQELVGETHSREGQSSSRSLTQEVVDVTHEALIRNWSLLKDWINDNRDMLRRQRRIETTAQEWDSAGQSTKAEYLLQGLRLRDAEDFIKLYPQELSALAQQYVAVSQAGIRRAKRESRQVQIAVPSVLLATLALVLGQYQGTVKIQAEQNHQLQISTARERALIAQNVLQNTKSDPMVALLLGRLAAEENKPSAQMQANLRTALQNLRLQLELRGHNGKVNQMVFSPNRQTLATASADGTIRLWALNPQTVYNTVLQPSQVLTWAQPTPQGTENITSVAFSPDGKQVAAIAENSPQVKVWSVETGALILSQLNGLSVTTQVMFSPNGESIIATHRDRSISIWATNTGKLQGRIPQAGDIRDVQVSPDGQFLLGTSLKGTTKLWQIKAEPQTQTFKEHLISQLSVSAVTQATFSPSGQRFATASEDGTIRLWDTHTGKLIRPFSQTSLTAPGLLRIANSSVTPASHPTPLPNALIPAQPVVQMKFSPNEQILATTDPLNRVWLWNISSNMGAAKSQPLLPAYSFSQPETSAPETSTTENLLSFSPDGQIVATVEPDTTKPDGVHSAHLWNTQTGKEVGTLPGHQGKISRVQFSPDGTYVATTSADGVVRFWSAQEGGEFPTLKVTDAPVHWAMFVQGKRRGQISAQANVPPNESPSANLLGGEPAQAAASPTHEAISQMVSITADGRVQRWQILTDAIAAQSSRTEVSEIKPQNFSNFFQWLMGFLRSRTQRLNTDTQLPIPTLTRTANQSPPQNGPSLANPEIIQDIPTSRSSNKTLSGAALSPDGQMVAAVNAVGGVELYQVQPEHPMRLVHRLSASIPSANSSSSAKTSTPAQLERKLTFSPDGKQLLRIESLMVQLWDVPSGSALQTLQGHTGNIRQARFSPDGQFIVTASQDKTARIWQVSSGKLVRVLQADMEMNGASFSPDGAQVVTAHQDGTAQIWNARTGEKLPILRGHHGAVLDAQFSPDGRSLVTASADGTARLWNTNGQEEALLNPNVAANLSGTEVNNPIQQAFFSPDGQYVATLTADGRIYLWAGTWDMLLKLAQDRSFRQLTPQECAEYLHIKPEEVCPQLPIAR